MIANYPGVTDPRQVKSMLAVTLGIPDLDGCRSVNGDVLSAHGDNVGL
jgi:hypothetical protein